MEKTLARAIRDYKDIYTLRDLKQNGLTQAEHFSMGCMIIDLLHDGTTSTFMEDVARWFEKRGFAVNLDADGVNYIIKA